MSKLSTAGKIWKFLVGHSDEVVHTIKKGTTTTTVTPGRWFSFRKAAAWLTGGAVLNESLKDDEPTAENNDKKGGTSVLDEIGNNLPPMGWGSAIGGGLMYVAGHFVLDSPLMGLGLAAVGALGGETVLNMLTSPAETADNKPPTEKKAPAPEKAHEKAPKKEPEVAVQPGLPTKAPEVAASR